MYQTTTMFKLRTKPTQFTKGRTEDTLCDLTQRYLLNINETDYHLIDIIVTNKSLPETEQWKFRTDKTFKNFKNITIDILSSNPNITIEHMKTRPDIKWDTQYFISNNL